MDFFTGGRLWTHILAVSNGLKLKTVLRDLFLTNKTLTDGAEWCGLLLDYCLDSF